MADNKQLIEQLEQARGFVGYSNRGLEERRRIERFIKSLKEADADEEAKNKESPGAAPV